MSSKWQAGNKEGAATLGAHAAAYGSRHLAKARKHRAVELLRLVWRGRAALERGGALELAPLVCLRPSRKELAVLVRLRVDLVDRRGLAILHVYEYHRSRELLLLCHIFTLSLGIEVDVDLHRGLRSPADLTTELQITTEIQCDGVLKVEAVKTSCDQNRHLCIWIEVVAVHERNIAETQLSSSQNVLRRVHNRQQSEEKKFQTKYPAKASISSSSFPKRIPPRKFRY
jgi:hypothetical protein